MLWYWKKRWYERVQRQLIKRLEHTGVRVLEINLYDLSIEILKKRGIWEQILEMETSVSKEQLKELLQGVLDPEAHLVPAIAARFTDSEFDVLFLRYKIYYSLYKSI